MKTSLVPMATLMQVVLVLILVAAVFFALKFRDLYRKERRVRRQLKALIENSDRGVIVINGSGQIVSANRSAESIFGYGPGELAGQALSVLLTDKHVDAHSDHVSGYVANPFPVPMNRHVEGRKKNGEGLFVEVSLSHFNDGRETTIMAIVMDATEQVRNEQSIKSNLTAAKGHSQQLEERVRQRTIDLEIANQELSRSQSLYEAMACNFPDGIIGVMGRDLTWLLVDGKGLAQLGLDKNTLKGDRVFDDIHRTITNYAEGGLAKVFEGEPISFDVSIMGQFYNVSSVPIYTRSEINEILVVIKNISPQKTMEQELVKTLEKEKELNILKSRFVTMASHEFRTPLTTILSSSFLLENYSSEQLEKEKLKHINRIKHAVHSLTELLNDFLSLGKLEEGMVQVTLKPVKIQQFGEEVLHEVSLLKKEEQRIVFEYSGDNEEIMMDKHLLRNILLNLLSNAVKYSPPTGTIGLTMAVDERVLTVKVSDQGIGIPQDEQKHIFKRFFRANNTSEIQGTGLGLNIVRRYVRLLKGKIEFQSRVNKGTVITVSLPLAAEK
jgi:PAS domain S-box-containing protein